MNNKMPRPVGYTEYNYHIPDDSFYLFTCKWKLGPKAVYNTAFYVEDDLIDDPEKHITGAIVVENNYNNALFNFWRKIGAM